MKGEGRREKGEGRRKCHVSRVGGSRVKDKSKNQKPEREYFTTESTEEDNETVGDAFKTQKDIS